MSLLSSITETKRLGMSVEDAVKLCAKAINGNKGYTLKNIDIENGSVVCEYTKGLFKFFQQGGNVYQITFVFNDDRAGGTICTGRIYNEYNQNNPVAIPVAKKMLKSAMELL